MLSTTTESDALDVSEYTFTPPLALFINIDALLVPDPLDTIETAVFTPLVTYPLVRTIPPFALLTKIESDAVVDVDVDRICTAGPVPVPLKPLRRTMPPVVLFSVMELPRYDVVDSSSIVALLPPLADT